jgi:hypothetical protein
VIIHSENDFSGPQIAINVLRFETGKAVKHWDNFQQKFEPNPSGHGNQYMSAACRTRNTRALPLASFSRPGNPYDNGCDCISSNDFG